MSPAIASQHNRLASDHQKTVGTVGRSRLEEVEVISHLHVVFVRLALRCSAAVGLRSSSPPVRAVSRVSSSPRLWFPVPPRLLVSRPPLSRPARSPRPRVSRAPGLTAARPPFPRSARPRVHLPTLRRSVCPALPPSVDLRWLATCRHIRKNVGYF